MSTTLALLGLLEPAPAYGYTLKRAYDTRFPRSKPLAYGQVYASLARFERQGLAEVLDIEAGDGPDRKRYRITTEGVTAVESWVYGPQDAGSFSTSSLVQRMSVALLTGRDAAAALEAQRAEHLARMRELTSARGSADDLTDLTLTYEIAHLDADLRWMTEAAARIGATS